MYAFFILSCPIPVLLYDPGPTMYMQTTMRKALIFLLLFTIFTVMVIIIGDSGCLIMLKTGLEYN